MTNTEESPEKLDAYAKEWDAAVREQDYEKGLSIAFRGYSLANALDDTRTSRIFLGFVLLAAKELIEPRKTRSSGTDDPERTCSFCLLKSDTLVRGVGVSICADCVGRAQSVVGT